MTTIGSTIKELRRIKNITSVDLAKEIGISQSALSNYENNLRTPDANTIISLSKIFNVTADYLLNLNNDLEFVDLYEHNSENDLIKIKVYGSIPAGIPIEAIECMEGCEEIPRNWTKGGKEFIALKVKGDSMYPDYFEGDVVVIQLQPDCETGEDCVCYVNGYDATLKRVKKNEDGTITLQPLNREYPPKTYERDYVRILGKVRESRRKR